MRKINLLVIHCSDSDRPEHDNIKVIDRWHKKRGFESPSGIHCGYHFFIDGLGIVHEGRPLEERGAHAKGYNSNSIGVCLSGRYHFGRQQFKALERLIMKLRKNEEIESFDIIGHNAVNANKTCPNFAWEAFVANLPSDDNQVQGDDEKGPQNEAKEARRAAPKKIQGKALKQINQELKKLHKK